RMLIRNIEIFAELFFLRNKPDERVRDRVRIAIEESHPAQFFNGGKLPQQCGNAVFHAEILAIRHGVLRNKKQLPHSLNCKATRFGNKIFHAPASELAAKSRDGAKRTNMIAAFGNL